MVLISVIVIVSYIFNTALVLFILFRKCGSKDENLIKEEKQNEILKILGLINNRKDKYILYQINK